MRWMDIHQFAKAINRSVSTAKYLAKVWGVGEVRNGKLRFYPSEVRIIPKRQTAEPHSRQRAQFAAQQERQALRNFISQSAPAPATDLDPTVVQDDTP